MQAKRHSILYHFIIELYSLRKDVKGKPLKGNYLSFFVLLEARNIVLLWFLLLFNLDSQKLGPTCQMDSIGLTKPQINILGRSIGQFHKILDRKAR